LGIYNEIYMEIFMILHLIQDNNFLIWLWISFLLIDLSK